MKARDVLKNYKNLQYKATNERFYYLKDIYPICLPVKDSEELFYLDTGGPMSGNINFFKAKIVDNALYRECDDGVFRRISPEVRIVTSFSNND